MIASPKSTREEFVDVSQLAVRRFAENPLFQRIDRGTFTLKDYHAALRMIFHQTFEGPATFALAAAHCDLRLHAVRDYLIEHAHEEHSHWQWVIEDLRSTDEDGPDPRSQLPHPACQAYVSFNTYLAMRQPVARLATAAVLEGIGANYGKTYAQKVVLLLNLDPSQLKFAFGHGDTDVGHAEDILRVLSAANLSEYDWAWLTYAARIGGNLYANMYAAVLT